MAQQGTGNSHPASPNLLPPAAHVCLPCLAGNNWAGWGKIAGFILDTDPSL